MFWLHAAINKVDALQGLKFKGDEIELSENNQSIIKFKSGISVTRYVDKIWCTDV